MQFFGIVSASKNDNNISMSENIKPERSDRQIALAVWDGLKEGHSIKRIADDLSIERDTIRRLRIVRNGFRDGLTNKQIIKKLNKEWTTKVVECREWFKDSQPTPPVRDNTKHTDLLIRLTAEIRSRIINPHVNENYYIDQSSWDYGEQNWRLIPDVWFRLVTPWVDYNEDWEDMVPVLKAHIKDKNDFFKHYAKLKRSTIALWVKYNKTINDELPELLPQWETLHEKLSAYAMAELRPSDKTPIPEDKIKDLPYTREDAEKILTMLKKHIPKLDKKFQDMEQLLQQLWSDLNPFTIEPIIKSSVCKVCNEQE